MTWGRAGVTAVRARASPAQFRPGGGSEGAVEAPFDALAALRRLPQLDVRLDLPGVALEVVGVDREPVLGRVAPRLRVLALAHPRRLGEAPEERHRVGAHGLDDRQRGLERLAVVVEPPRPLLLVVALDDRVRLREEVTDTRVAVRLGVGAVADDLVGRPLPGRAAPLSRVLRDLGERRLEAGGGGGGTRDQRLALRSERPPPAPQS